MNAPTEQPDKNCLFCDIIAGHVPGWIVVDDDDVVGFLDTRPVFAGHVLVVPRQHHRNLFELPRDLIEPVFGTAQLVARALETALHCDGALVLANNRISQSVDHLHVHVIPRNKKDGLRGFMWPRQEYAHGEIEDFAPRIASAVTELKGQSDA